MPAIRRSTIEGRVLPSLLNGVYDSVSVEKASSAVSRFCPFDPFTYASPELSKEFCAGTVNPSDLFVIPPSIMVVPSQAAALVNTPVGEYLAGITFDTDVHPAGKWYMELGAAATKKVSKARKEKAKSKENLDRATDPKAKKNYARSKRKDPNYIPRSQNAFMIFRSEFYKQTRDEGVTSGMTASPAPGATPSTSSTSSAFSQPSKIYQNEFSKLAAEAWRRLPPEEKRVYERRAVEDKDRVMLLRLQKQKDVDAEVTERGFEEFVWLPEGEETKQSQPSTKEREDAPVAIAETVRKVEVIDLTQDDECNEKSHNSAPSSRQFIKSYSWSTTGTGRDLGIDLSPRSYYASIREETEVVPQIAIPQVDFTVFPPAPSTELNSSSQLHMPTPTIPISTSITQLTVSEVVAAHAYAPSSSPSSSTSYPLDVDAPSPSSTSGLITPAADSTSIASQLFGLEDLGWSAMEFQEGISGQTDFKGWLPSVMPLEGDSSGGEDSVQFAVPDLNVNQWCW